MDFVVVPLVFLTVLTILVMSWIGRWRREQQRLELQKAILERVGSVKDLAEFLTTDQGERFLGTLAPTHFRTHHRTLWSVRIGVVLLTIGLSLMVALHTSPFGVTSGNGTPKPLLLGILLLIAAGIGMLLSAAVAYVIGRALGVDGRNGRSS